jgi:uncharacterized protein YukE
MAGGKNFYGADVEQLLGLAQKCDTASESLTGSTVAVSNGIQVAAWVGPASTRFKATWSSQHRLNLNEAANLLKQAAAQLKANALDQRDASDSDAGRIIPRTTATGACQRHPIDCGSSDDGLEFDAVDSLGRVKDGVAGFSSIANGAKRFFDALVAAKGGVESATKLTGLAGFAAGIGKVIGVTGGILSITSGVYDIVNPDKGYEFTDRIAGGLQIIGGVAQIGMVIFPPAAIALGAVALVAGAAVGVYKIAKAIGWKPTGFLKDPVPYVKEGIKTAVTTVQKTATSIAETRKKAVTLIVGNVKKTAADIAEGAQKAANVIDRTTQLGADMIDIASHRAADNIADTAHRIADATHEVTTFNGGLFA